jgi:hypothetical protein
VGLASGGMVPVMLEPGERVFTPPVPTWAAAMNRAIPRFGSGGFLVPGSGEGDRVPAWLQEGTFIMNRRAASALGLHGDGSVGLQGGGTVRGGLGWGPVTFNITIHQQPGQNTRELIAELRRQISREWRTGNSGPV